MKKRSPLAKKRPPRRRKRVFVGAVRVLMDSAIDGDWPHSYKKPPPMN